MRARLLLAGVAVLAVAACSKWAGLVLTGPLDRPTAFISDSDGRTAGRWRSACINRLEVAPWGDWDAPRLWEVAAEDGECVRLRSITYGEVPRGFVEISPPAPLVARTRYSVSARGWTQGFASIPWVAENAFIFEDEWTPAN